MSVKINLIPVQAGVEKHTYKDINCESILEKSILTDLESIRNRIDNLFNWSIGTRILLPGFGNALQRIKYEPLNELSVKNAEATIRAMFKYEPEVTVTSIVITPLYDKNEMDIRIDYQVPSLDVTTTIDFNIQVQGD